VGRLRALSRGRRPTYGDTESSRQKNRIPNDGLAAYGSEQKNAGGPYHAWAGEMIECKRRIGQLCVIALGLAPCLVSRVGAQAQPAAAIAASTDLAGSCASLAQAMTDKWPDRSSHIVSSTLKAPGPLPPPASPITPPSAPPNTVLPSHCEINALMHERLGADGQNYAIRFHLRLPVRWNGRFVFQGGGGLDGDLGDAIGPLGPGIAPALTRGFAVVSQDAGHDNASNSNPARNGLAAFAFDARARADMGYASLQPVADAAKAVIAQFYGRAPEFSYFVGCSKGGQEGLAFAERYPDEFNGIVAGSPGLSLPRAAVAEAWDTQTFAALVKAPGKAQVPFARLAGAFSDSDLQLVREAVLAACDADDGLKDGIVGDFTSCTSKKVLPALAARTCHADKRPDCLSSKQVEALKRSNAGPRDVDGKALYSDWPWDAGVAGFVWRIWKIGSADGRVPALNVFLGGPALSAMFTTPPTALSADPQSMLDYLLGFDFTRDAARIYATDAVFTHSAWDLVSARSADLTAFSAHGGKLIVSQGVSDPVFSILDTLAWYREVQQRAGGKAEDFSRVFPVPGMNHCLGGPATDNFDALQALVNWVELRQAPDRILASA